MNYKTTGQLAHIPAIASARPAPQAWSTLFPATDIAAIANVPGPNGVRVTCYRDMVVVTFKAPYAARAAALRGAARTSSWVVV